ncbi:helix-turn-helix domain-containing protein [Providencia stuartii]|uniref:winged helix-turn-helix domain-containing protein n=1 Tax=Providencia stuartii TaxID=588 RepID=UPI00300C2BF2
MIYTINSQLKYNSEDGSIYGLDNLSEPIATLTPVLNRILKVLIENKSQVMPRDRILELVWDKHGLVSSSNPLNQYISMLRKLFSQYLNVDNAILTIPKKGMMLSSELLIEKEESKTSDKILEESTKHTAKPSHTIDRKKISVYALCCILIFICISMGLYIVIQKNSFQSIGFYQLSKINTCPVYAFKEYSDKAQVISTIKRQVARFNITCKNGDYFYYYDNNESTDYIKHDFLAKCNDNTCVTTRFNF